MKYLVSSGLALALAVSALTPSAIAQDLGVRIGPNGAGIELRDRDRDHRYRGREFRDRDRGRGNTVVIERRGRPDCRMVEVRTHRRGETIIKRERRCD